jgi:translation elongation factor aEF-1 beta
VSFTTGSYVIRLKVLPADINTEHEKIVKAISDSLPAGAQVRGQKIEPIAFGLSAIILDIVAPEQEGIIDSVEQCVSTAPLVGQYELVGVSRMSSKLHTGS